MRQLLISFLAITLCACAATSDDRTQNAAQPSTPPVVDEKVLLVLTTGAPTPLVALARANGYSLIQIDPLDALGEVMVHLRIPDGRTIPEAIDEIEALQPGVTAGANHAYTLQTDASGPGIVNSMLGWPETGCRAFQNVGLIDADVGPDHPQVRTGRIVRFDARGADLPGTTTHGTLMADLMVGAGRLNSGTLFSANVVDPSVQGNTAGVDAILRALNWLRSRDVTLVNISLAGPVNKLMNRAMSGAAEKGVLFVAAAGNAGPDSPPQYPAAFPYVLAVTAVDQDLAVYRNAVRGDHIDVAAPGVDIILASGGKTRAVTGTSVATALVTSAIAADRQFFGETSIDAVRNALARSVRDLGQPGVDPVFGAGMIIAPEACRVLVN